MKKDIFKEINSSKSKYEILLVLGIICIVIGFLTFAGRQPIGALLFIGGGLLTIIAKSGYKKIVSKLKTNLVNSILSEYIEKGVYYSDFGVDSCDVYNAEILKKASRYQSEDYIEGEINNVHFISSDVHLQERRSTGKSSHYVTYFKGRFFQFDFNKNFDGKIFVLEGNMPFLFHGYDKIKLESVEFNQVFNTYTDNEHHAFYVLTPHFMEALLELEAKHHGKITMSFINNKLNIAINDKSDTFECAMFRHFDENIVNEFKSDILIIKSIIDSLKLDRVIFKEE